MAVQFSKVTSGDRIIDQIQSNIAAALNPILAKAFINGQILSRLSLASGSNSVPHSLGQNVTGFVVIRQRGPASIYDTQDSNASPSKTLNLNSSAAVSVDLYVF
jgi:hypothetical protein